MLRVFFQLFLSRFKEISLEPERRQHVITSLSSLFIETDPSKHEELANKARMAIKTDMDR